MKQFFMIRDEVTGMHLPCRSGYSYSATTVELTLDKPPRLFTTQSAARQSANCWQRGVLTPVNLKSPISFDLSATIRADEEIEVKGARMHVNEVPARKNAKLQIIPVDIVPATL